MSGAMTLRVAALALALALASGLTALASEAALTRAVAGGFILTQAMVPRTGMMDAQHPMPMNERYLKRFPQPARVGDLIGLPVLDLNSSTENNPLAMTRGPYLWRPTKPYPGASVLYQSPAMSKICTSKA